MNNQLSLSKNTLSTTLPELFELCKKNNLRKIKECYELNKTTIQTGSLIHYSVQYRFFQEFCEEIFSEITSNKLEILSFLFGANIFNEFVIHRQEDWAFRMACHHGHVKLLRCLLDSRCGWNINIHVLDEVALLSACSNGHEEVVKELLLRYGTEYSTSTVDNTIFILHNHKAISGNVLQGAFKLACDRKKIGVIKVFLNLTGAQKIDQDSIQGAISHAQQYNHVDVVNLLSEFVE